MVDLQVDSGWKLSLEAKVESLTLVMEEIKRLIVNKHSQRQHKMLPPNGLEYNDGLQLPTHTRAISPLKEFTSKVVLGLEQIKPTPPLEPSLKEPTIRLVNIGKVNLVVDKVMEEIRAPKISREGNLGVISIVDNEGLEVDKDHVEVQKKEATTIPRNLDIDF